MDGYVWIDILFICLLVGILWTMNEREKAFKKEAEERFSKNYKYFWKLYSLYHFGKSLSDSGMNDRIIEWKLEIRNCLKDWGGTKNRDFGLNLPSHATRDDYLSKLEETLADHSGLDVPTVTDKIATWLT